MPRDSVRRRNRSRSRTRRSPSPNDGLTEKQRRIKALEAELERKNRSVKEQEKRLFGTRVEINANSYRDDKEYMSPIRIGVPDASSLNSDSPPLRYTFTPPQSTYEYQFPPTDYPFEAPPVGNQFPYEFPPEFYGVQPHFYRDDQEVRVDEMPKWPMHGSPENSYAESEKSRSFSPTPRWKNQQDVQVDPMPVFPVEDDEEIDDQEAMGREERARIQMMMIAQQAEQAESQPRSNLRREEKRKSDREREEKRKARIEISKYRDQVLQKMEQEKKEKELRQREKERKARHALQRKQEEAESSKRKEMRRREEISRQSESDEFFLQYLIPAIGSLDIKSSKLEAKNPIEYVTVCNAVNIPKELLYGSKIADTKGESYKGAISNYVEKLVGLGVIDSNTRRLLKRIEKLPKFLAEMVEPLCNDIAIYGTQISVTDARDMRSKFEAFAMEKSAEFWKSKDNTKKLADYLKKYDRKRNPSRSRSRSRDRKRSGNSNRRRSPSRNRPTASPGNKESLKMLFASADNSSQLPANFDQFQAPPPNFIPTLPSILSMPLQPSTMNFQPPPVNYPPNGHLPMMNGYGQYPQQMMPMPQPTQFPPIRPQGYTMSREDEAALMDEIFS